MADGVFQHLVKEAGLEDDILVDSAGTGSWHIGERAHPGTRRVLEKNGIHYEGRARQISRADLDSFDYVLAMDDSNLSTIQHMAGSRAAPVIDMFLSYANSAGTVAETEVPDPYYDGRFDEVYDLVLQGSQALLAYVRSAHNL